MLYERWREIAEKQRDKIALRDFASGRRWTFAELFAAGESWDVAPAASPASVGGVVFPQGHSPEFILGLLAAWRENQMVCPLEPGQLPPEISLPPKNCVYFKSTSATTGSPRWRNAAHRTPLAASSAATVPAAAATSQP